MSIENFYEKLKELYEIISNEDKWNVVENENDDNIEESGINREELKEKIEAIFSKVSNGEYSHFFSIIKRFYDTELGDKDFNNLLGQGSDFIGGIIKVIRNASKKSEDILKHQYAEDLDQSRIEIKSTNDKILNKTLSANDEYLAEDKRAIEELRYLNRELHNKIANLEKEKDKSSILQRQDEKPDSAQIVNLRADLKSKNDESIALKTELDRISKQQDEIITREKKLALEKESLAAYNKEMYDKFSQIKDELESQKILNQKIAEEKAQLQREFLDRINELEEKLKSRPLPKAERESQDISLAEELSSATQTPVQSIQNSPSTAQRRAVFDAANLNKQQELDAKITEYAAKIKLVEEEFKGLFSGNIKTIAELKSKLIELLAKEKEFADLKNEIENKNTIIAELKRVNDEISKKNTDLVARLTELEAANATLGQQDSEQKRTLEELKLANQKLLQEKENLNAEVIQLKQGESERNNELKAKLEASSLENAQLKEDNKRLQTGLTLSADENQKITAQIQQEKARYKELKNEKEKVDAEIQQVKQENQQQKAEIQGLKQNNEGLQQQNSALQEQLKELQAQLAKEMDSKNKVNDENNRLKESNKELHDLNQNLRQNQQQPRNVNVKSTQTSTATAVGVGISTNEVLEINERVKKAANVFYRKDNTDDLQLHSFAFALVSACAKIAEAKRRFGNQNEEALKKIIPALEKDEEGQRMDKVFDDQYGDLILSLFERNVFHVFAQVKDNNYDPKKIRDSIAKASLVRLDKINEYQKILIDDKKEVDFVKIKLWSEAEKSINNNKKRTNYETTNDVVSNPKFFQLTAQERINKLQNDQGNSF